MKQRYIIFIACISAGLLSVLPAGRLSSCGPSLVADETRLALFRSDLDGRTALRPFYYSENLFNLSEPDPEKLDQHDNCSEWVNYSNKEVNPDDVFSIQYATTPARFSEGYKKNNWKGFENNSFINWLLKKQNRSALEYMALAKRAEGIFITPADPWDTVAIARDEITSLINISNIALTTGLPEFLQNRYAFQTVKLFHYNDGDNSRDLITTYNRYLSGKRSIVARWALIYYAMAQKNESDRILYLLKAFDASEEKKRFCFQQLSLEDLATFQKQARDGKTLALIHTMTVLKTMGKSLNRIKALYAIDPKSKYLPLLISREVNKLENWIWSGEILGFPYDYMGYYESVLNNKKDHAGDKNYLGEVIAWLRSISSNGKPYQQLALIHLLNMQKKYPEAQTVFQLLPAKLDNKLESQRQIEKIIILSQSANLLLASTKQELALSLNKLISLNPILRKKEKEYNIYPDVESEQYDDLAELFMLLSNSYKKAGDLVTAALLFNKVNITVNEYSNGADYYEDGYGKIGFLDRYGSAADIEKTLAFKHLKKKTKFEQLITPAKWANEDMYRDVKGTILLRQKKFAEALAVFKSMDPKFWINNYEYKDFLPPTSVTHTGSIIPGEKDPEMTYPFISKQFILNDVVGLLDKISNATNDQSKAVYYYKLANAYFNMTYYGKAWMMFSYGKSSGDWSRETGYRWATYNFYPNNIKYGDDYYGCRNATETYKKALTLTRDKELAAKCLLMLNYCDNIMVDYTEDVGKSAPPVTDWLKILTTRYKKTYYFKEAEMNCADVKEYVDSKKATR